MFLRVITKVKAVKPTLIIVVTINVPAFSYGAQVQFCLQNAVRGKKVMNLIQEEKLDCMTWQCS